MDDSIREEVEINYAVDKVVKLQEELNGQSHVEIIKDLMKIGEVSISDEGIFIESGNVIMELRSEECDEKEIGIISNEIVVFVSIDDDPIKRVEMDITPVRHKYIEN